MSYESDLYRVRKNAEQQGWRYRKTDRGHHQFLSPNGEDIVHASGTPGDQRSWNNFLGDMRRAGYRDHANGASLGDLGLGAAVASREQPEERVHKVSVRQVIRDRFQQTPAATLSSSELSEVAKLIRPELSESATSMTLSKMAERGEVERVKMGWYRLPQPKVVPVPQEQPPTPPMAAAPPDPQLTGDAEIDAQAAAMDAAITQLLDAFSTIEKIMRRQQAAMRAVAETKRQMKKMLEGM